MKYSMYNTLVPVTEQSDLLYNAFTDTFLVVKKEAREYVRDNPSYVKEHWRGLYRSLVQNGCYVADKVDEYARLKSTIDAAAQEQDGYLLTVNPTLDCNVRCWYCYEEHKKGSNMNGDTLERVKKLIGHIVDKPIRHFTLGFFGGEPLMKFSGVVLPLAEWAKQCCEQKGIELRLSFTTNGILLTEDKIVRLAGVAPGNFQITLDGDEESHNRVRCLRNGKGSYRRILDNVSCLLKHGFSVTLRINYTKENIASVQHVIGDLDRCIPENRERMWVNFQRVWQDRDTMEDLPEAVRQADLLTEKGFRVQCGGRSGIKSLCYGDRKNTAVVNYNGNVHKCTARDFSTESRDGYLDEDGNIVWEKPQEYRLSLKLTNKICRSCSIAPLCGGGCTQAISEQRARGTEYCLHGQNPEAIRQVVVDHVEEILRMQSWQDMK